MNEILTNLVNLLQQRNNRLEHMEKNQEKILMEVTKQTEEAQWNKHHTTLVTVDDAASILVNDQKGGKKPPDDSNRGSNNLSLYCSPENLWTAMYGRIPLHSKAVEIRKIVLRSAAKGTSS